MQTVCFTPSGPSCLWVLPSLKETLDKKKYQKPKKCYEFNFKEGVLLFCAQTEIPDEIGF